MEQTEFDKNIEGFAKIYSAAETIAEEYVSVFCGDREYLDHFEIDYDGFFGTIEIHTSESYCGCCPSEHNTHSIPLSSIVDSEWIKAEKIKREEAKAKKKQAEIDRKARQKEKAEKDRYESYLAMKKEYENK